MTVCPVCGKECHSDYCIFCMRPIYAEDTKKKTKKIFSRSDDMSDIIDPELYDEETVSYVRDSYEQAKKEARINALKHNGLVLGIFLLCVISVMIVNKIIYKQFRQAFADLVIADNSAVTVHKRYEDLADFFEFYKDGIPVTEDGQYIYSYNIFGLSDGRAVKIQLFADEMTERDGKIYFYGNNRSLVSIGKAEDLRSSDGGILTPQAFNSSGSGSANGCVSFETEGPFRLIPDDYDADGDPDIVLRSSDIGEQGAYYSLLLSSKRYYPWQPNNCYTSIGGKAYPADLRSNADTTFFIWGEDDPSIKLRWLDDDHFFFLTMLEEGANDDTVFAFVVDRNTMTGERADTDRSYVQDGRIYCAHYEDKTICCDIVDCSSDYPDDLIPPEGHGTVMLYRLDGSDQHKACEQPVDTMFIRKNSMESTAALQMELYPGLYRVDIATDGCTGSAWLEVI